MAALDLGVNGAIAPPRMVARLRRVGAGERVLKTALAVGIAWQLGSLLPVQSGPYLAPLAALLSMQITVADSLSAAGQRLIGIVVGVLLAIAVNAVVGINGLTVGVLVGLALAAGSLLRLGPIAVQQVAVSALLLVAVGGVSSFGYAVARIAETLVGAAVGVAVNALLAPPTHLEAARIAVSSHAAALAAAVDELGSAMAAGIERTTAVKALDAARASDGQLRDAQSAVVRTETAHRFNLWNRGEQPQVERLAQTLRVLERVAIQSRGIVRTVAEAAPTLPAEQGWLSPGACDGALAAAVSATASMIRVFPEAMLGVPGSAGWRTVRDGERRGSAVRQRIIATADASTGAGGQWVPLGSVLADLGRIQRELAEGLGGGRMSPGTTPSESGVGDEGRQ